jgi:flagellar hook-associated protein 1 FlgK
MGVNFSPFEIGKRALRTSQFGVTVAGQNIANVNTPGYTRQSVQLSPTPPFGTGSRVIGSGVTIDGVRSFRDRFVDSRLQNETSISGRLTGRRDAIAPVDDILNEANGGGIGGAINSFFNSFRDLEAHPTSEPLRAAAVRSGEALAAAFHSTRSRLESVQREADGSVRAAVDDINALAQRVAELNASIRVAVNTGGGELELLDQRGEAIRQLSELAGVRTVENQDGTVTLTLPDGRPLVFEESASQLQVVSTPPNGFASLTLDGEPAVIAEGRARGLLDAVGEVGGYVQALDDLAASIATRVNALHASGSDLDDLPGTPFFTVPAGGAPITAANLAVSPILQADPARVVTAATGAGSGDASVARSISSLLTDPTSTAGARSGSFSAIHASIVADAGASLRSVDDALTTQQAIVAQTAAQRDAISGVSLDEEAINLLQYQRAYEAATRFLQIADEMTQTILSLGQ